MSKNRYTYAVAVWDREEDIVLGEGSGPASHVIANLERMIEEIKRQESASLVPTLSELLDEDSNLPGTRA